MMRMRILLLLVFTASIACSQNRPPTIPGRTVIGSGRAIADTMWLQGKNVDSTLQSLIDTSDAIRFDLDKFYQGDENEGGILPPSMVRDSIRAALLDGLAVDSLARDSIDVFSLLIRNFYVGDDNEGGILPISMVRDSIRAALEGLAVDSVARDSTSVLSLLIRNFYVGDDNEGGILPQSMVRDSVRHTMTALAELEDTVATQHIKAGTGVSDSTASVFGGLSVTGGFRIDSLPDSTAALSKPTGTIYIGTDSNGAPVLRIKQ